MEIFPLTTVNTFMVNLAQTLNDNLIIVIGVLGLVVGIQFVVKWFNNRAYSIAKAEHYRNRDGS